MKKEIIKDVRNIITGVLSATVICLYFNLAADEFIKPFPVIVEEAICAEGADVGIVRIEGYWCLYSTQNARQQLGALIEGGEYYVTLFSTQEDSPVVIFHK